MLKSADRHYAHTRALALRAVREARKGNAARTILRHQAAAASTVTAAISAMLAEQGTPVAPSGRLAPLAFTTAPDSLVSMLGGVEQDWQLERLVASLVADAARAAESVSIASRPRVGYVRYVSPPCCSRCAILAGRFYRWSSGFARHPGCDCTHLPTTDPRSEFRQNPHDLVARGLVRGLSKADQKALTSGADLSRLVNLRSPSAGLAPSGTGLVRGRRPTPAAIYRQAGDDRDEALELLATHGYITT
jgi:hypothetical protein